jgi:hypothetical protein
MLDNLHKVRRVVASSFSCNSARANWLCIANQIVGGEHSIPGAFAAGEDKLNEVDVEKIIAEAVAGDSDEDFSDAGSDDGNGGKCNTGWIYHSCFFIWVVDDIVILPSNVDAEGVPLDDAFGVMPDIDDNIDADLEQRRQELQRVNEFFERLHSQCAISPMSRNDTAEEVETGPLAVRVAIGADPTVNENDALADNPVDGELTTQALQTVPIFLNPVIDGINQEDSTLPQASMAAAVVDGTVQNG